VEDVWAGRAASCGYDHRVSAHLCVCGRSHPAPRIGHPVLGVGPFVSKAERHAHGLLLRLADDHVQRPREASRNVISSSSPDEPDGDRHARADHAVGARRPADVGGLQDVLEGDDSRLDLALLVLGRVVAAVSPPPRREHAHRQRWSQWRRRHQYRASQAHRRWNLRRCPTVIATNYSCRN